MSPDKNREQSNHLVDKVSVCQKLCLDTVIAFAIDER